MAREFDRNTASRLHGELVASLRENEPKAGTITGVNAALNPFWFVDEFLDQPDPRGRFTYTIPMEYYARGFITRFDDFPPRSEYTEPEIIAESFFQGYLSGQTGGDERFNFTIQNARFQQGELTVTGTFWVGPGRRDIQPFMIRDGLTEILNEIRSYSGGITSVNNAIDFENERIDTLIAGESKIRTERREALSGIQTDIRAAQQEIREIGAVLESCVRGTYQEHVMEDADLPTPSAQSVIEECKRETPIRIP